MLVTSVFLSSCESCWVVSESLVFLEFSVPLALILFFASFSVQFPELWEERFGGDRPFRVVCFKVSVST